MSAKVGVPREVRPGERRVALVPATVPKLLALGVEVLVEAGAGAAGYFPDDEYANAGARLVASPAELFAQADIVVKVQPPTLEEAALTHAGQALVGFMEPALRLEQVVLLRDRGVTAFAMELLPRITRAQSMDALTSQASIAGYRGALAAASALGRFFPMLTTPTGTIRPAKVLVLGAGVAGLQAIATCRRLGAMVEAYDVRPAAREQVESLGARFLSLEVDASAAGGYARALTPEERVLEGRLVSEHVAQADAVITTAALPGRKAPLLVTREMVERMRPGSVIVDLAAEGGGNCELTEPGATVVHQDVTVLGPLNVPSELPVNASETYARNILDFLGLLLADGELAPRWDDEVVAGTVLTRDGAVPHGPTLELLEQSTREREGGGPAGERPGEAGPANAGATGERPASGTGAEATA